MSQFSWETGDKQVLKAKELLPKRLPSLGVNSGIRNEALEILVNDTRIPRKRSKIRSLMEGHWKTEKTDGV